MKVEDIFSPSNVSSSGDLRSQGVGRPEETRATGRAQGTKAENSSDAASLSALSLELSRAVNQDSPEMLAKIDRLQETVANGSYDVPSSEVSARIVASALKTEL